MSMLCVGLPHLEPYSISLGKDLGKGVQGLPDSRGWKTGHNALYEIEEML